jgi:outer membrane receptor protein involved in Fe transport
MSSIFSVSLATPASVAVACMLVLLAPLAHAQSSSEEEDLSSAFGDKAMVSIATGSQQLLRRAPAVATVITAQDIAAMGATDLDEVMETVPGVHVSRGIQGYIPLYVMRGIYGDYNSHTLMLQNGVPMTTMLVGNRGNTWYGLPLENIARIEIIRGPGSALYGADAYSGVINIITKTAADTSGTEVGMRAGSFNTRSVWAQHGGKLGPVDVAAYLRAVHTDGFKEPLKADTQSLLDRLFGTQATLAPGPLNLGYEGVDGSLDLSYQKWRFRAGYKLREGETGPGIAATLDPVGRVSSERITADMSWNGIELTKDWDLGLMASYLQYKQQFPVAAQLFPAGAFGGSFPDGVFGAPNTWERQLRLSLVSTYSGLAGHNLRVGLGHDDLNMYRTQEFKNFTLKDGVLPVPTPGAALIEVPVADSFLAPTRRTVDYVYVQDEWRLARDWTLTGGLRRDHYSDFGDTTNPRVALVWDASLDWTAKLLYGQAFRAPAFAELFTGNNPVVRGNPKLSPETISTWEAVIAWQARPDTSLNLSLYKYRMKDIIRMTAVDDAARMSKNAGAQHGHGMELETTWKATAALQVEAHYAWQRSIDDTSGQDAGYAPRHHLFGRVDWSTSNDWSLGAQLNHVAGRQRAAGDVRPNIADYTTVDLTVRRHGGVKGWEFTGGIRNLFNADAREPTLTPSPSNSIPDDLPQARRSMYLQAIYRL